MNVLFQAAEDDPELVERAVARRSVTIDDILDWLSAGMNLDLTRDRFFDPIMSSAFLPVVSTETWQVLADANPVELSGASEWVVCVPSRSGDRGVLIPEDSSSERGITMFAPLPDQIGRITIRLGSTGTRPVGYRLSGGGDCGDPIGEEGCERNACGQCVNEEWLYKRHYSARICRCPHG